MKKNNNTLNPCPFCGSIHIDPEGWLRNDGVSGPACETCGASAGSTAEWNRRVKNQALEGLDWLIAHKHHPNFFDVQNYNHMPEIIRERIEALSKVNKKTTMIDCMDCDGCGWCEGSPSWTCTTCKGKGQVPL